MAVYFAPQGYGSRSAALGSSIGQGLSKTLEMLAQNKLMQQQQSQAMQMQEMQKQQKAFDIAQGLSSLGIPQEVSEKIAFMPESQQNLILKQFFGSEAFGSAAGGQTGQLEEGLQTLQGAEQAAERQGAPGIEQLLGEPGKTLQAEPEQVQAEAVQTPEGEAVAAQEEEQAPGANVAAITQQVQSQINKLSPSDRKALKEEISRLKDGIPLGATRHGAEAARLQKKPTQQKSFQELLATPRPTAADKARAEQLAFKKEKLEWDKQKAVNAETKEFYNKTLGEAKDAKQNDMRLNRMAELNEKGDLNSPGLVSALNTIKHGLWGVGVDLKWLMTPDSQEFEKLSNDFLKNAKAIFGARVTQGEIEMFLKTIPSLLQTKNGRRRVIRNMKIFNEGAKLKKDAMSEIIDMNGGRRPMNIELLVEKKIAPKMDKLSEKFIGRDVTKKKEEPKSIFGKIFGGIESARQWLNPNSRY